MYKEAQPSEVKILREWAYRQVGVCDKYCHIAQKSGCSLKNVSKIDRWFSSEKGIRYYHFSNPLFKILLQIDKNLSVLI